MHQPAVHKGRDEKEKMAIPARLEAIVVRYIVIYFLFSKLLNQIPYTYWL